MRFRKVIRKRLVIPIFNLAMGKLKACRVGKRASERRADPAGQAREKRLAGPLPTSRVHAARADRSEKATRKRLRVWNG
jgi:hypothetical protein